MSNYHPASLRITHTIPQYLHPGSEVQVEVFVACPLGCNLEGRSITLTTHEGSSTHELQQREDGTTVAGPIPVAAGGEGTFVWKIDAGGEPSLEAFHHPTRVQIPVTIGLHDTTMAVWDVTSPVSLGARFMATVGVQCSAGCDLGGLPVQILDEGGTSIRSSLLEHDVLPGTALHCVTVELDAPPAEGVSGFVASFTASSAGNSHPDASAAFTIRVDRPPAHRVRLRVVEKDSRQPVDDIEVRLGHYTAFTDENGDAILTLPGGPHELTLRKDGYGAPPRTVEVGDDLVLEVEAYTALTRVQREANITKMFEDYPWS